MKRSILFATLIVFIIILCTILISDGPAYLVVSLMAFAIMFTIYRNRKRVIKMTRWSKANPGKAQLLITGLQVALMALGIISGNNLKELGYEFSNTTAFVFSAILVTGFLCVPFLPQRKTIVLPHQVNRQRFAFMSIALSSFVLMILFGNRLQDKYPNSPITKVVKKIDQAIFPDNTSEPDPFDTDVASEADRNEHYSPAFTDESAASVVFASFAVTNTETIKPSPDYKNKSKTNLKAEKRLKKFEKKKAKLMKLLKKQRLAFAGMSTGVGILLIILLCIPLCAGICLFISFSSVGAVLGGIALLALSIFGIVKVGDAMRKRKEEGR